MNPFYHLKKTNDKQFHFLCCVDLLIFYIWTVGTLQCHGLGL